MSALPKLTKAAGLLRDLAATLSHVDTEHLTREEAFKLVDLRG